MLWSPTAAGHQRFYLVLERAGAAWSYIPTLDGGTFISYMDPHSVVERAQLVNGKHLRGPLGPGRSATQENKELIRRYIRAIDDNDSSDWSLIDEYVADDFVAHNPPLPRVSLDRDG